MLGRHSRPPAQAIGLGCGLILIGCGLWFASGDRMRAEEPPVKALQPIGRTRPEPPPARPEGGPARKFQTQENAKKAVPQLQSQRDLRDFVESKFGEKEPPATAAEARRLQEKLQYQRPYFRSGEERRSAHGVLDTSLTIVYDERKVWRPGTVDVNAAGNAVLRNVVQPEQLFNVRVTGGNLVYDAQGYPEFVTGSNDEVWNVKLDRGFPKLDAKGNLILAGPQGQQTAVENISLLKEQAVDVRLRSYEGRAVGPTLRVKPGEILRVKLKNQLPPEDPGTHPSDDQINRPHEFNTTNLHTHGLHVSPAGNGDNVLASVGPGEEFVYEVSVPEDHIPGTFWYHAHRHGSTAMQLSSGMAGALIVEPADPSAAEVDNIPAIKGAEERVCVFQLVSYLPPNYEVQLKESVTDPDAELPKAGKRLMAVGRTNAGQPNEELHFRVYNEQEKLVGLDPTLAPAVRERVRKRLGEQITKFLAQIAAATKPEDRANLRRQLNEQILQWAWMLYPADQQRYELENFDMAFGPTKWRDGKGLSGWRTTINGQFEPTMRVKSGKMQRFRFIHAGVRDAINVQFTPLPVNPADGQPDLTKLRYDVEAVNDEGLREFARDGIPLAEMRQTGNVELFPGYRSDALARFTNTNAKDPVYYVMWNGPTSTNLDPAVALSNYVRGPEVLGVIEVMPGTPLDEEPWPGLHEFTRARKPAPLDPRDVVGLQTVDLQLTPQVGVNGRPYDPKGPPLSLQLGRTDEWKLTSPLANHPFHIHVNPFYVVSKTITYKEGGRDKSETVPIGEWKDTLLVQQNDKTAGGVSGAASYKILTNYKRYIGDFVLHCHILDHEDTGMMMGVSIKNSPFLLGTRLANPFAAHDFELPNAKGEKKKLKELLGEKATVLVFLERQSCSACNSLMRLLKDKEGEFKAFGANIVIVAPKQKEDNFPDANYPLPVVFDKDLAEFQEFGVYVERSKAVLPLHGVFILNAEGKVHWRETSATADTDLSRLLQESKAIAALK